MNRIPVVFIIPNLQHGGAERVLFEIATHLDPKRFAPSVICFAEGEHPFASTAGITRHCLFPKWRTWQTGPSTRRSFRNIRTLLRLAMFLRRLPENAVLIPFLARPTTTYTAIARWMRKTPIIASLHTTESVYLKHWFRSPLRRWLEELSLRFACMSADRIVAVSEGVRADLVCSYGIPSRKIAVLPNPLDLESIRFLSRQPSPVDQLFKEKEPVFVHVGRLSKEKNHHLLIRAAAILRDKALPFHICIAGNGDQQTNIRALIAQYGLDERIRLLGSVDNPYALMRKARALVLTSHYDSSPMVLKEAMACGTAVIAVDCPHGPADILDHGKYGLLVPPNDPESLAEAMIELERNDSLWAELKTKGRERAKAFGLSEIMPQWEAILAEYQKPPASSCKL